MWARIESGMVAELTDINPDDRYHPSYAWAKCGKNVSVGWMYDGKVFSAPQADPPQLPVIVTMRQARLALHTAGLLQSVEDAISAMPEPEQTSARIEWDYASRVERSSQFVVMLGAAIGLDDAQMDELFMAASIL